MHQTMVRAGTRVNLTQVVYVAQESTSSTDTSLRKTASWSLTFTKNELLTPGWPVAPTVKWQQRYGCPHGSALRTSSSRVNPVFSQVSQHYPEMNARQSWEQKPSMSSTSIRGMTHGVQSCTYRHREPQKRPAETVVGAGRHALPGHHQLSEHARSASRLLHGCCKIQEKKKLL